MVWDIYDSQTYKRYEVGEADAAQTTSPCV